MDNLITKIKRSFITHLLMAYVFLSSGLLVNFLQFLSLPLWYLGYKEIYRRIVSFLTYLNWGLIPGVAQWWAGMECHLYATPEDRKHFGREPAIAVLNHRAQLDWVISWVISDHCNILQNAKCMVKSSLAYIPVIGFGFWFSEYIFLKRKLEKDRHTLSRGLKNLTTFSQNFWMLIFCEGSRYTAVKHKASNEFALKKGMTPLKHHLLPRTKGFYLTLQGLRGSVNYIYDATVCFRHKEPLFTSLLEGKPCVADFHVRRIPVAEVPDDEEACAQFVHDMYSEKDEIVDYHKKHNVFAIGDANPKYEKYESKKVEKNILTLFIIIFWSVVTLLPLFYYAYKTLISGSIFQISVFIFLILFVAGIFHLMIQATIPATESRKSK